MHMMPLWASAKAQFRKKSYNPWTASQSLHLHPCRNTNSKHSPSAMASLTQALINIPTRAQQTSLCLWLHAATAFFMLSSTHAPCALCSAGVKISAGGRGKVQAEGATRG